MRTKLSLLMVSATLMIGIISCGGSAMQDTTKPALNVTPAQLAVKKDPVCGMDLTNAKISDTAMYNGGTYGFCSDNCKQEFKKDPAKFAAGK